MNLISIPLLICAMTTQAASNPGTIQGLACDFDGCKPIAGVRISIQLPNSSGTKQTISTETGAFIFTGLPSGRYQLEAEADGFSPVAVLPLVTLSAGGRVDDIHVFMRSLGTISGHAFDEKGEPLRKARVDAMVFEQGMHLRMLVPVTSANTDDSGAFSLPGLGPDEYYVRVTPPLNANGTVIYPPTFYPDAMNPDSAAKTPLGGGMKLNNIEIRIPLRGATIAGRFVTQSGEAVRASSYLIPRLTSTLVGPIVRSELFSEEFEIRGVPPGSYYLYAVTNVGKLNVAPADRLVPQWVRVPVEVGDDDIKNLKVQITPAGSIIGRIVLSPDALDSATLDLSKLLIEVGPTEVTPGPSDNYLAAKVSSSGEFHFDHLSEMTLFLWKSTLNEDWFVSRLLLEGSDVMSSGFSAAPGQDRVLEITISNASGYLRGIVKDRENNPVRSGRIVLLPAPALRANPSLLRIALTDDNGQFVIETIPPGEYTAIAFPPEDQSTRMFLRDVQWVEQYERFGQRVQVVSRQSTRIDLVSTTPVSN